jgi:hypothetical protein
MNATELFTKEGKSAGVFYCATCKIVHRNEHFANECCGPNLCAKCNEPRQDHYLLCDSCRNIADHVRELERFNKAVKLTDWDGTVYSDGFGSNEGYFRSIGDMEDELEECERPDYVYACHEHPVVNVTIDNVIDWIMDGEFFDGFDSDDIKGTEDLEKALAAFREVNKGSVNWNPDYSRVVVIRNRQEQNP